MFPLNLAEDRPMDGTMPMVPIGALRPGDEVIGEVRGTRNRLLCGAGVRVTADLIAGLKEHGVKLVHVAARGKNCDDLDAAQIAEIESKVRGRFALVAADSPLQLLHQTCLSVLLGTAQEGLASGDG